jgi:hypothetical protein
MQAPHRANATGMLAKDAGNLLGSRALAWVEAMGQGRWAMGALDSGVMQKPD